MCRALSPQHQVRPPFPPPDPVNDLIEMIGRFALGRRPSTGTAAVERLDAIERTGVMMAGPVRRRALADADIRTARRARLWEPHVAPLVELADRVAAERGLRPGQVPYPDPAFGGTKAEALVLLQNPFRGDDFAIGGSGLVSLENDELVAAELWDLHNEVGLEPAHVMQWNAVPWFCGRCYGDMPSIEDRAAARPHLASLIELLPQLRVVLLFGHVAEEMWVAHRRTAGAPGRALRTVSATHPWLIVDGVTNSQRRRAIRSLTYDALELVMEIISTPDVP